MLTKEQREERYHEFKFYNKIEGHSITALISASNFYASMACKYAYSLLDGIKDLPDFDQRMFIKYLAIQSNLERLIKYLCDRVERRKKEVQNATNLIKT